MPSCKPCKKAWLKGEPQMNWLLFVGLSSIECALDLKAPSIRPPLRTNMKLIEHAHSN